MTIKNYAFIAADIVGHIKGGPLYSYALRPAMQVAYDLYYKTKNVTNIAYNVLSDPIGTVAIHCCPPISHTLAKTAEWVEQGTRKITQPISKTVLPKIASSYYLFRIGSILRQAIPYYLATSLTSTPIESKPRFQMGKLEHFLFFCFSALPILLSALAEESEETAQAREVPSTPRPVNTLTPQQQKALEQNGLRLLYRS